MSRLFSQKTIEKKDDKSLIEYYKETLDNEVIGEFYRRYQHIVFGVALKYMKSEDDAQDVLLEVFNNMFEQLIKYDIDDFKSWLLTVTKNKCFRILKNRAKIGEFSSVYEKEMSVEFMETESEMTLLMEKEAQIDKLKKALLHLKAEQQQCIMLFYLEGKSYNEVSDITGYDVKKVKSYIQNGKRNLLIKISGGKK